MITTTTTSRESAQPLERGLREESRWARSAPIAGIAFVVLNVASAFAPGVPPASDASTAKVVSYFRDHSGGIKAQLLLGGLGIAALMWWLGALWGVLSRAEGERPRLAAELPRCVEKIGETRSATSEDSVGAG